MPVLFRTNRTVSRRHLASSFRRKYFWTASSIACSGVRKRGHCRRAACNCEVRSLRGLQIRALRHFLRRRGTLGAHVGRFAS
eukprot:3376414-Pyramimonas_sp.AAC.1